MRQTVFAALLLQLTAGLPCPALPADILAPPGAENGNPNGTSGAGVAFSIAGRVTVLDGRTLWFPQRALKVRLAGIDSCELPQWSYDPQRYGEGTTRSRSHVARWPKPGSSELSA
jgi:endonuclease YncB( thermonuclease family)